MRAVKTLHCCQWIVKNYSGKSSKWESYKENLNLREFLSGHGQNAHVDGKSHCDEISDRNKDHIVGNWRKGDP